MAYTHNTRSRKLGYFLGLVLVVGAVGLLFVARGSQAEDRYAFLIRGDVMEIDTANKNVKIYFRHVNSAAEHDQGQTIEVNVRRATFYKYNMARQKIRTTLGTLALGDEVVVKGLAGAGTYDASWVVENDNLVKILGTVESHNPANNYLQVDLSSIVYESTGKAYKASSYTKGDVVRIYYDEDSAKFTSRDGVAMNSDEISNNNEKVTLRNIKVKYGSRLEADASTPVSEIIDGRHK